MGFRKFVHFITSDDVAVFTHKYIIIILSPLLQKYSSEINCTISSVNAFILLTIFGRIKSPRSCSYYKHVYNIENYSFIFGPVNKAICKIQKLNFLFIYFISVKLCYMHNEFTHYGIQIIIYR